MQLLLLLELALLQQASKSAHVPPLLELFPALPPLAPPVPLLVLPPLHAGIVAPQDAKSVQLDFPRHALTAEIISLEFEHCFWSPVLLALIVQLLLQSLFVKPTA